VSFYYTVIVAVSVSCFDRFFRHVNLKENKLISKRRGGFFMDDLNLIGVDYLWRVSDDCWRSVCDVADLQLGLLLLGFDLLSLEHPPVTAMHCFVRRIS